MRNKPNEWISIADLMTGVVGVVLLFFVMMAMQANRNESRDSKHNLTDAELGARLREATVQSGAGDPATLVENAIQNAKQGKSGKWPPFFSLNEADGYYFESGTATIRLDFRDELIGKIVPSLLNYTRDYNVDVVEVIGHTDEVPMTGSSNLDASLIAASNGQVDIKYIHSTDNAGLALARAVAVVQIIRPYLKDVTILPLSAGQMIMPVDKVANGSAAASDQSRRRIEIRLRKSTGQAEPTALRSVR